MPYTDNDLISIVSNSKFDYAKLYNLVTPEALEEFLKLCTVTPIKKGEFCIKQGEHTRKVGIVLDGLMRAYYNTTNGEKTVAFFEKFETIASLNTIAFDAPCRQNIEALEDSVLIVFDQHEFEDLSRMNAQLFQGAKLQTFNVIGKLINTIDYQILFSPEERYKKFIKERGHLLNKIPQNMLASYLGVTPVSLSRIRKKNNPAIII